MTADRFDHVSTSSRVLFGNGRVDEVTAAVAGAGIHRPFVVATRSSLPLARRVGELVDARPAAVSGDARMHTPVEVTDDHLRRSHDLEADGFVAVGGGSAIGLAKALALRTSVPIVAVPTTYSGSEMTSVWGATENGRKKTGRDPRVTPAYVIYDPELTIHLPHDVAGLSGLNSIAHAVEAIYAPERSPLVALTAAEAIKNMRAGLRSIDAAPGDLDGYARALTGAWLSGVCLAGSTMSLHHKLCHVLGGTFDTPHAATHAFLLPYVLAYNSRSLTAAQRAVIVEALGGGDPCKELVELGATYGAPKTLADLGLRRRDLDVVVEQVPASLSNPRPVEAKGLRQLLDGAFDGAPPEWTRQR